MSKASQSNDSVSLNQVAAIFRMYAGKNIAKR